MFLTIALLFAVLSIGSGQIVKGSCKYWPEIYSASCLDLSSSQTLESILTEIKEQNLDFYSVIINGKIFSNISHFDLQNLTDIYLQRNQIKHIRPDAFDPPITQLDLSYNILGDDFRLESDGLKGLKVKWNLIKTVSRSMFYDLQSMTSLNLAYNKITSVEPEAFGRLTQLQTLDLKGNMLTRLPDRVFENLTTLFELDLSSNYIETLRAECFVGLTILAKLFLNHNFLASIGQGTFTYLKELELLDMSYMKLKTLNRTELNGIVKMNEIYLSGNFIEELDSNVFSDLHKLTSINLDDNVVVDSCQVLNYAQYQTVNFKSNFIVELRGDCFDNSTSSPQMVRLVLSKNKINKIDARFFKQVNNKLEKLDLSQNYLQFIKNSYFNTLMELKELDLSTNQISFIEAGSFHKLSNLVELFLDGNCLFYLEPLTFKNLNKLNMLMLQFNVLNKLDSQTFTSLSLTFLYLSQNRLNTIPNAKIISFFSSSLDLSDNYLRSVRFEEINFEFTYLTLTDNMFLRSFSFLGSPRLELLDISRTSITNWQYLDQLQQLTSLLKLNLSMTSKKVAYEIGPFIPYSVTVLDLSYIIDIQAEYYLTKVIDSRIGSSLTELYLNHVNLTGSLDFLRNSSSLTSLDLSGNSLDSLELVRLLQFVQNLINLKLEKLNISDLTELNLTRLPGLKKLYLSWNKIEYLIKDHFKSNTHLRTIDLSHNQIKYVENGTFSWLADLQFLYLNNNYLTQLEPIYRSFLALILCNNRLESLDNYDWSQVQEIDLSCNRLSDVSLIGSEKAELVNLSFNYLIKIDSTLFQPIPLIKSLFVTGNRIKYIEPAAFKRFSTLTNLDLSQNYLKELDNQTFLGLLSLQKLNLSMNQLERLNVGYFTDLVSLTTLDLSSNHLKHIQDFTFEPLTLLAHLSLKNNSELDELTNYTLSGIENSIRLLELDRYLIQDESGRGIIRRRFHAPRYNREILEIKFYYSVGIVFLKLDKYDDQDCALTLLFASTQLQVNLYSDEMAKRYLIECQTYFNSLIN